MFWLWWQHLCRLHWQHWQPQHNSCHCSALGGANKSGLPVLGAQAATWTGHRDCSPLQSYLRNSRKARVKSIIFYSLCSLKSRGGGGGRKDTACYNKTGGSFFFFLIFCPCTLESVTWERSEMGTSSQSGTRPEWGRNSNGSETLTASDTGNLSKLKLSEQTPLHNWIFHQALAVISYQCFCFTFVNMDQVVFFLMTLHVYLDKDRMKMEKDLKYVIVADWFCLFVLVNILFQAQCIQPYVCINTGASTIQWGISASLKFSR